MELTEGSRTTDSIISNLSIFSTLCPLLLFFSNKNCYLHILDENMVNIVNIFVIAGILDGKESDYNAGDPGLGSSPGEGIGYPLQYSWGS